MLKTPVILIVIFTFFKQYFSFLVHFQPKQVLLANGKNDNLSKRKHSKVLVLGIVNKEKLFSEEILKME